MPKNDDFRLDLPPIPPPWKKKPGDKVYRVPRTRPWRIPLPMVRRPRSHGESTIILVYGFAALIILGTILLMLPISSNSGEFTSPVNAIFTATSAVCVTGLVVVDTADYWNGFGQIVILVLIQLGGLGFMTSATIFFLMFGRRIGLKERRLIGRSLGLERMGGLVKLVKRIVIFTVIIEIIGAAIFYIRFSMEGPTEAALWKSVFQSVSAFNNAGFDIFGSFRSMLDYQSDTLVVLTTGVLVILGGISFVVVADVGAVRRFARLALDSKIVIVTTAALLMLGMGVFLLTEYSNPDTLGPLSVPYKFLNALFHSITPRTAGFSTINVGSMADYSLFFAILLMFVGGAAGSTAGGIKVNTFGMLIATMWSSLKGKENAGAFGREFTSQQIHRALALVMLALGLITVVVFVLTVTEEFKFLSILFETFSAFGTVGLSTGITPDLSIAGKLIITATMFIGRLGPLILALSLIQRQLPSKYRYPQDEVRIG
ncbi:MAG TPA: TrkH family potassium uptake protein [Dehalococcoidia bacterium]|nr:TrkH family potassium uptake protein [Dehalococcoidia bacterium]